MPRKEPVVSFQVFGSVLPLAVGGLIQILHDPCAFRLSSPGVERTKPGTALLSFVSISRCESVVPICRCTFVALPLHFIALSLHFLALSLHFRCTVVALSAPSATPFFDSETRCTWCRSADGERTCGTNSPHRKRIPGIAGRRLSALFSRFFREVSSCTRV